MTLMKTSKTFWVLAIVAAVAVLKVAFSATLRTIIVRRDLKKICPRKLSPTNFSPVSPSCFRGGHPGRH